MEFAYRGARILTNPPPSAGGVLLALTLKTLEALDVASLAPGSSEHLQALLETMTAVNDGRARADGDLQQLLQIYREQVAATAQISRGTTHISIMERQVISQLQDFQATPEKAVHFPRAHFEDNLLSVEAGFETGDLSASWDGLRIQPWDSLNLFFGGVHLASLREGEFEATGDPRRGGVGRLVIA